MALGSRLAASRTVPPWCHSGGFERLWSHQVTSGGEAWPWRDPIADADRRPVAAHDRQDRQIPGALAHVVDDGLEGDANRFPAHAAASRARIDLQKINKPSDGGTIRLPTDALEQPSSPARMIPSSVPNSSRAADALSFPETAPGQGTAVSDG